MFRRLLPGFTLTQTLRPPRTLSIPTTCVPIAKSRTLHSSATLLQTLPSITIETHYSEYGFVPKKELSASENCIKFLRSFEGSNQDVILKRIDSEIFASIFPTIISLYTDNSPDLIQKIRRRMSASDREQLCQTLDDYILHYQTFGAPGAYVSHSQLQSLIKDQGNLEKFVRSCSQSPLSGQSWSKTRILDRLGLDFVKSVLMKDRKNITIVLEWLSSKLCQELPSSTATGYSNKSLITWLCEENRGHSIITNKEEFITAVAYLGTNTIFLLQKSFASTIFDLKELRDLFPNDTMHNPMFYKIFTQDVVINLIEKTISQNPNIKFLEYANTMGSLTKEYPKVGTIGFFEETQKKVQQQLKTTPSPTKR